MATFPPRNPAECCAPNLVPPVPSVGAPRPGPLRVQRVCERAAGSEERVAIYHLSVKLITRGAGRSSTAAAAYRSADRVDDERTGLVFDYSRKRGVEHTEIVLPANVADSANWARNRARLWNAAEAAERRCDARVAREYEVALPHELDRVQRLRLVQAFAQELADRHGGAVDFAIHAPHREGDIRNHHAHILATTRRVEPNGLGAKTDIELKDADRQKKGLSSGRVEVTAIRERWAALVNGYLEEHGHTARIDHRSLEAQGVDRDATYHKGPTVTAIERREVRATVAEWIREEVGARLALAAERGRLERESQEIARSIIVTTADLRAAVAARDAERIASSSGPERVSQPSMAAARQDAQSKWLALVAERGRAEREARATGSSPVLDLTSSVASATALRAKADDAATREQSRSAWLAFRAEQEARTPTEGPRIIIPDHEHTPK